MIVQFDAIVTPYYILLDAVERLIATNYIPPSLRGRFPILQPVQNHIDNVIKASSYRSLITPMLPIGQIVECSSIINIKTMPLSLTYRLNQ